jgi:thiamine-monophosphate kinase
VPRPLYIDKAVPLAEKTLIAQIRSMARRGNSSVLIGIGDDCAVLRPRPGQDLIVTTDFSLEGVHFRRDWHSPDSVGHRCLARGFSDIAAMGGEPVAIFLSLALPRSLPQRWVQGFMRGLIALADKYAATLSGGDTAESPGGILADVVVVGSVPKGKAVLRSGARPGDRIIVSGALGGSAAAIVELRKKAGKKINPRDYVRHFFPEPRVELGSMLRTRGLASAMIDTSDGLSTDLAHICVESGVGAVVQPGLIPRARVGKPAHEVDNELALHGGEDYELLFTSPKEKRIPAEIGGVPITQIGIITRGREIFLVQDGVKRELKAAGWEHFGA